MSELANAKTNTNDPDSIALSRARLYRLLSDLFRQGLSPEMRAELESFELTIFDLPAELDHDLAAADHFEILDLQIPPFESLFRDPSGLVGGQIESQILERCLQMECDLRTSEISADHVVNELLVAGELCRREQQCIESGDVSGLERARRLQLEWLSAHPIRWLHSFCFALFELNHPFYSQLGELTLELVESQLEELNMALDGSVATPSSEQESQPFDIDGPRKLAEYLCLPICSGLYLSKAQISVLATQLELTTGFTTRAVMLQNVIESAIKFEKLDAFLSALEQCMLRLTEQYLNRIGQRECLRVFLEPWVARLRLSRSKIKSIELIPATESGTK